MQEIEDARIVAVNLAGAPVAEIVVQFLKSVWHIIGAATINNVDVLIGVGMEEAQPVLRFYSSCRRVGDGL